MATSSATVESDLPATSTSPYHLPQHLPTEPKIGTHVMYADHGVMRDALVQVVFPEHGMPPLTLVLVKPGSRGDLQTRRLVPHKSKCHQGEPSWCRPEEVAR